MKKFKYCVPVFQTFCSALLLTVPGFAQDSNILHPIAEIEQKLQHESFDIVQMRDIPNKSPKRALLRWADNKIMQVKWKKAVAGGTALNNEPRYEMAAYELQKLFLEPQEYVVPPTIGRSLPLVEYRRIEQDAQPTFEDTECVFFCLQYWLEKVSNQDIYDKKRLNSDTTYARHLGNLNILSYLVKHKDSNVGNFLISTDPANPRVFAVDNSLAFASPKSLQGDDWQKFRVKRLPEETVRKLRQIQKADLERALGVVAQFAIQEGQLEPVEPTENLAKQKGVRRSNEIIQFGLKDYEITAVFDRLRKLINRVDAGKIAVF